MSNFYIGDEVSITGRIKYIDDDGLKARVEFLFGKEGTVLSEWIHLQNVTRVKSYQRKLNVGDRVVFKGDDSQYLWVAGQQWLRIDSKKIEMEYYTRDSITFDTNPDRWEYYPRNVVAETQVSTCTSVRCEHSTLYHNGGDHCMFDRCPNGLTHCPIHPIS